MQWIKLLSCKSYHGKGTLLESCSDELLQILLYPRLSYLNSQLLRVVFQPFISFYFNMRRITWLVLMVCFRNRRMHNLVSILDCNPPKPDRRNSLGFRHFGFGGSKKHQSLHKSPKWGYHSRNARFLLRLYQLTFVHFLTGRRVD